MSARMVLKSMTLDDLEGLIADAVSLHQPSTRVNDISQSKMSFWSTSPVAIWQEQQDDQGSQ